MVCVRERKWVHWLLGDLTWVTQRVKQRVSFESRPDNLVSVHLSSLFFWTMLFSVFLFHSPFSYFCFSPLFTHIRVWTFLVLLNICLMTRGLRGRYSARTTPRSRAASVTSLENMGRYTLNRWSHKISVKLRKWEKSPGSFRCVK